MFLSRKHLRIAIAAAAILVLGGDSALCAGTMAFRNDTKSTLILQETVIVNGQSRPGRPQKLFAGEMVRETWNLGGQRRFTIIYPNRPQQPLYSGSIPASSATENLLYILKPDGRGGVTIEAQKK